MLKVTIRSISTMDIVALARGIDSTNKFKSTVITSAYLHNVSRIKWHNPEINERCIGLGRTKDSAVKIDKSCAALPSTRNKCARVVERVLHRSIYIDRTPWTGTRIDRMEIDGQRGFPPCAAGRRLSLKRDF